MNTARASHIWSLCDKDEVCGTCPCVTTRRPWAYAFVTSNSEDFSAAEADKRNPHDDLADAFAADHSTYGLGADGLEQCLRDEFDDYLDELTAEMHFPDDPRGLDEILAAEKELFDKIWYERSSPLARRQRTAPRRSGPCRRTIREGETRRTTRRIWR